jgi:Tol biopolymer transport system component
MITSPRPLSRGLRLLGLLLAMIVVAAGLANPASANGGTGVDTSSVRGTLVAPDGSTPISGGIVELTSTADGSGWRATTGTDGAWSLPAPAGDYTVYGFAGTDNPGHYAASASSPVTAPATGFVTVPLQLRAANVLATVTAGGNAYAGADVSAWSTGGGAAERPQATSSSDGVAPFVLPDGSYSLEAQAADNDLLLARPISVTVTGGSAEPAAPALILTGPDVSGQIRMPDGTAATGSSITSSSVSTSDASPLDGVTSRWTPAGTYGAWLNQGTYDISVDPDRSTDRTLTRGTLTVTFAGTPLTGQDITLTRANITGTITLPGGAAAGDASVSLIDANGDVVGDDTTDATGGYALRAPATGTYRVQAQPSKPDPTLVGNSSTDFSMTDLTTVASQPALALRATNLRGTVVRPDGVTPATGGYISVSTTAGEHVSDAETTGPDDLGRWGVLVPAGDYRVTAEPDYYDTTGDRSASITVTASATPSDGHTIRLVRPTLSGVVQLADGSPVADADLRVVDTVHRSLVQLDYQDLPDANGHYSLLLPAGSYRIVAAPSRYSGTVTNDVTRATQDVVVQDGDTDRHLDLVLGPDAAKPFAVERLDVATGGAAPGDGATGDVRLTDDGRYAVFSSSRSGLVSTGVSGSQVYLRDRISGTTELVSVDNGSYPARIAGGTVTDEQPAVSRDGRWVVFVSDADNLGDSTGGTKQLYLRDRQEKTTTLITQVAGTPGAADSLHPSISDDGSVIAFWSLASNLADPAPTTSWIGEVHLATRGTDGNWTISRLTDLEGTSPPALSADGSTVAFHGKSGGTWSLYVAPVADLVAGHALVPIAGTDPTGGYDMPAPAISSDGSKVAFVAYAASTDPASSWHDFGAIKTWSKNGVVSVPTFSDAPAPTNAFERVGISQDGSAIGFGVGWGEDVMGSQQAFVQGLATASSTDLASVGPTGDGVIPGISSFEAVADGGNLVAFSAQGDTVITGHDGVSGGDGAFLATRRTDTTPPAWSTPASALTATTTGATVVELGWAAADDASGVKDYLVYQGTTQIGKVSGATKAFTATGLQPDTDYEFSVAAVDTFGNSSVSNPTLRVHTTSGGGATGTAVLTAAAGANGTVNLAWDIAEAGVDYRVMRALGDGDFSEVAVVPAGTTTYRDSGLLAETRYRYRVDRVVSGDTAHTRVTEVTTTPLNIDSVDWSATQPTPGILDPGGTVQLTLVGDPGRHATALVSVQSWFDSTGVQLPAAAPATVSVPLTEDAGAPGTYRGTYTLPDGVSSGVAALTGVTGQLDDGAGHPVTRPSIRAMNLLVRGALDVVIPDKGELAGAKLEVFSGWQAVDARTITGPGTQTYRALEPADNYVVRLTDADGRELASETGLTVRRGLHATVTLDPKEFVRAAITVTSPTGEPVPNQFLSLYNGTDYLRTVYTDDHGMVSVSGLPLMSSLRVVTTREWPAGTFVDPDVDTTVPVHAGGNAFTIAFGKLPAGTLSGAVTLNGVPAPGATVSFSQRSLSQSVKVDAAGHYSFPVVAGVAGYLSASTYGGGQLNVPNVTVAADATTTQDLSVVTPQTYTVNAKLFTQYAGQPETEVSLAGWREVVHYDALRVVGTGVYAGLHDSGVVSLRAYPGTKVQFCGGGSAFGLGTDCGPAVTLPVDSTTPIDLELHLAQPQRLTADVVDEHGNPAKNWLATLTDSSGNTLPGGRAAGDNADPGHLDMAVQAPGDLTLTVTGWRLTPDGQETLTSGAIPVTVPRDGAANLPPVVLRPESGAFAGAGNELRSMRPVLPPAGVASFRATYTNGGTTDVPDAVVRLHLPAGATLPPHGLLVDGSAVDATASGGVVDVPVGTIKPGGTGVVLYYVSLPDSKPGDVASSGASVVVGGVETVLGTASARIAGLTMVGPTTVSEPSVVLRGQAPPDSVVQLFDGDNQVGSTVATIAGTWRTAVALSDRGPRSNHPMTARTTYQDKPLTSDLLTVVLDTSQVVVTKISISQSEGTVQSFDPRQGVARFPLVWVPGRPFTVDVEFSDPSRVANVTAFVGSQFGDATKLPNGVFRASVMGDGSGEIAVEYDDAAPPMTFHGAVSVDQLRERLPLWAQDFEVTTPPTTLSDGSVQTGISLPGIGADLTTTVGMKDAGQQTVSEADRTFMSETGVPVFGVTESFSTDPDTGKLTMTQTAFMPKSVLPANPTVSSASRVMASALRRSAGARISATGVIGEVIDAIEVTTKHELGHKDFGVKEAKDFLNDAQEAHSEGGDKFDDVGNLYDELANVPPADQAAMRAEVDGLMQSAQNATLLGVASDLGFLFAAPTGPLGEAAVWVASEGIGKFIDADFDRKKANVKRHIAAAIERQKFRDYLKDIDQQINDDLTDLADMCRQTLQLWKDFHMTAPAPDCDPNPPGGNRHHTPGASGTVVVDPSGMVYEGIRSNRLAGVTTTLLQAPTKDGPWSVWDADWFNQSNPLVTGANGEYAWDVPMGWWKVEYSKAGYVTGSSEPMEVLPPRFNVDEGLVSLEAPTLTSVQRAGDAITVAFDKPMLVPTLTGGAVTATSGGQPVTGSVAAIGAETSDQGDALAKSFTWTANAPLPAGDLVFRVGGAVQSYARVPVGNDLVRTFSVTAPPADNGGGSPAPPPVVTPTPSPSASPSPSPAGDLGASAPGRYEPLARPTRVLDTRSGAGQRRSGAVTVKLPGSVPADATGVLLNVTVTAPTAAGHVVVYPAGTPMPGTSNVNFVKGQTQANLVLTRLGPDRTVTLYVHGGPAHVVVDLVGSYVAAAKPAGALHRIVAALRSLVTGDAPAVGVVATTPSRVLDTRAGLGATRGGHVGPLTLQLPASVPAGAKAVLLNVTATQSRTRAHVTAYAAGQQRPDTSNLNVMPNQTQANLALVPIGPGGKVVLDVHGGPLQLIADLVGYQLGDAPAVPPVRLMDTRSGLGGTKGARQGPVRLRLPDSVPADAKAVILNVTVVGGQAAGYVTAYASGAVRPDTSNLNYAKGQTQANLVVVPVGKDHSVVLDVQRAAAYLVVDLVGVHPAG